MLAWAFAWVCACAMAWPGPAHALVVIGEVRDADTGRLLYTEHHQQSLAPDGAVQSEVARYLSPQGVEIGRKTLDFKRHRTIPRYRMDLPQQGYAEGIREVGKEVQAFKVDQGKETSEVRPLPKGLVAADSGFNQLLLDQMPRLKAGETVSFVLIVPGKLDQFQFRARKVGEAPLDGQPTLRLKVEPDSMLRWLVAPIELAYDTSGTHLLQYRGISNVLDPATGKVYPRVQIRYGQAPQAEPPTSSSGQPLR